MYVSESLRAEKIDVIIDKSLGQISAQDDER